MGEVCLRWRGATTPKVHYQNINKEHVETLKNQKTNHKGNIKICSLKLRKFSSHINFNVRKY